ncbi:MAG: flagellar export protein FliJ [Spirochaetaceae bacterium]|jgi:flagellar FliJ protein|nr:flagellar export protein FliJ [Spirochaetaceae bacterium]
MKRFKFRLEKILELRKYRERETEIALGKAVGELNEIERKIADIAEERLRMAQFVPNGTADILAFDRYIVRLDTTKAAFLEKASRAERIVEEARTLYLEASRDRKVLDSIKERQQKEYQDYIFAEETKELDDIASGVKARRLAAGGGV